MKQIVIGIIVITAGGAAIIFRRKFVNDVIKLNNKGLGFYRYGEREKKIGLWFAPLFGLLLIALGILILFGIFELR